MGQADPILTRLGAGPSAKKLVETAIILSNSQDPQQRTHAFSFMETAIKELEGALSNHNNGPRNIGSGQSSDNCSPYPNVGNYSSNGEYPMQGMQGTINQWNETGSEPINSNQFMQMLELVVKEKVEQLYRETIIPLKKYAKLDWESLENQRSRIKELGKEIREIRLTNEVRHMNLGNVFATVPQRDFKETTSYMDTKDWNPLVDQRPHKPKSKEEIQSEIFMDNQILNSSKKHSMYR